MKKILFLLLSVPFLSCNPNQSVEKPEKLIEEETMEAILYDLALLQALKGYNPQKLAENNINPKTYIYQKYKIDSLQLVENNRYYSADVENYKKMFDRVIERLDTEKKAADKIVQKEIKAEEKKRKDSIVKARKQTSNN